MQNACKMATIHLIQDLRTDNPNKKEFPIKIRLVHKRIARDIPTGFSCPVSQWDGKELLKPFPNVVKSNNIIREKFTSYQKILLDNYGILDSISIDQVKSMLVGGKGSLFEFWQNYINSLYESKRDGTAHISDYALRSVKKFAGRDLRPQDVTDKFLEDYCKWWPGKPNGVSVYLRALQRVLNLCIKERILKRESCPFPGFKIPNEKTRKRAVKKDVINLIRNAELTGQSVHHRNYFIFMFNTMGMNFVDLANLKKENIQEGRILYKRTKTKGHFNIKITAEAQRIIDLYKSDSDYLFPIIRDLKDNGTYTYKRYKYRLSAHNKYLTKIAKGLKLDAHITSYVVRHSFATIGKTMGIPTPIIQESLGHLTEEMTQVYLDSFQNDVMDKANESITG